MSSFEKHSFLIALISPSGGGKTAILREILKDCANISYSISYTTRPARFNEVNGKDYHFISEKKYSEMKEAGDFLEHAQVHGYWYGTSRNFIEAELAKGQHIILDIDVWGALQIIEKDVDVITIFILPPTQAELVKRLKTRKTETEEVLRIRLETAEKEMKEIRRFDYLVINDVFEDAVQEVKTIIHAEENKLIRYKNIDESYYGGK
ncbi:MAG: guanylate kinase [Candidatus Cloacimonadales bacterium]|nr:guanylate kinase [Candidatus Cloacimonadales bacterium]